MAKRNQGMSQREFDRAGYPMSLSAMADYVQEWMDQYRPGQDWPEGLDDAVSAAWNEELGLPGGKVTPKLRGILVDWFLDHY